MIRFNQFISRSVLILSPAVFLLILPLNGQEGVTVNSYTFGAIEASILARHE